MRDQLLYTLHVGRDSSFAGSLCQSPAPSVQEVPTSLCMKCSDLARLSRHTETSGLSLLSIPRQMYSVPYVQYNLCPVIQCPLCLPDESTSRDSANTAGLRRAYRRIKYADRQSLLSYRVDRLHRLHSAAPNRGRAMSPPEWLDRGIFRCRTRRIQ